MPQLLTCLLTLLFSVSRFLSTDPLGHASDPSLYTFSAGDPINFFDPDGRGNNPTFSQADLEAQRRANPDPWVRAFWAMHDVDMRQREDRYAGMLGLEALLVQANAAGQAAYERGVASWNAFAGWMNRNAQLDAIDNRIAAEVQAVWQPVIDRANANLWNSVVAAGRFQAFERSIEAQANANYQISRAMGWASGDLTWAQQWRYRRTDTYESTLQSAASWSLMLVPGGAPARAAGLAARGAGFGLRAELAAFGAAERGVVGAAEGGTTLYRAVGPAELADIQANGILRNLGSAEGKYFTTSAEAASSYAKQAVSAFGDPPYTLIQTRVPNSIFEGLTPATVDRGIPAWVIPNNRLPGLTPQVLPTMPIPLHP